MLMEFTAGRLSVHKVSKIVRKSYKQKVELKREYTFLECKRQMKNSKLERFKIISNLFSITRQLTAFETVYTAGILVVMNAARHVKKTEKCKAFNFYDGSESYNP